MKLKSFKNFSNFKAQISEIIGISASLHRDLRLDDEIDRVDFSFSKKQAFHVFLVRPTRYDDKGYSIHWRQAIVPSNSLACMYGIALDSASRNVLGNDVEIRITAFDESSDVVVYQDLIKKLQQVGQRMLLCLVGVQTNQFPRAMDIAQFFISAGEPVCIGGFHVSGCVSMLEKLPQELIDAQERGVSLFAGEAESGRFDQVLIDACQRSLRPLYDFHDQIVPLENPPAPVIPEYLLKRYMISISSIDLGRGCPFNCSFCCIINVHGHKSRSRSVDDLEKFVRNAAAQGVKNVFITDDNLARNRNWELYFDRLILLREEGLSINYFIQVDTQCHKIPQFIDKAVAAGVIDVFIGLENINPDNLTAVKKSQNNISEYREMLLQWKRYPVILWCAYIIGMPNDSEASILRDIEIIKEELPIDILVPSILTPLPGSEDHQKMLADGVWMDPDLNKYNLCQRVTHHPIMTDEELDRVYKQVWDNYYSYEHMKKVLRRSVAVCRNSQKVYGTFQTLLLLGVLTKIHKIRSYEAGLTRRKKRVNRRSGMTLEFPPVFHIKNWINSIYVRALFSLQAFRLLHTMKRILHDPSAKDYRDMAISETLEPIKKNHRR
ncbi:MAG TPA: radical SAM protein [Deltaproteobacteria bacterium]|nr:radical SAM protein [Deltaproteobacteria bacterium]